MAGQDSPRFPPSFRSMERHTNLWITRQPNKQPRCVSRPGRRVYYGIRDLPRVYNGLGIAILSTPRGVLSDNEARTAKVGGEVLCHVF